MLAQDEDLQALCAHRQGLLDDLGWLLGDAGVDANASGVQGEDEGLEGGLEGRVVSLAGDLYGRRCVYVCLMDFRRSAKQARCYAPLT